MNSILSELGGAPLIGWIIGLFTFSAGISRPFSGKLADIIGRKKVMFVGLLVCLIASLAYPFAFSVWMVLTIRFIHGFSTGFFPTGATALVTDLLPTDKRGMGMGIWGTFISLGIGVGQGLGSPISQSIGHNGLFITAGIFILFSWLLLFPIKETLIKRHPFQLKMLSLKTSEFFEPHVIPIAIVMFLSAMCSGIIFVLSPELSHHLGIENKGAFFIYYVLSTIVVRLVTGRISDRIGRPKMLLIGMSLLTLSMLLIGVSNTPNWYTFSSIIFGIATGTSSPTLFAWTADLAPVNRRGIGTGTMFIALEFGIFSGSVLTNELYDHQLNSIFPIFLVGACMAFATVIYLIGFLIRTAKK